MPESLPLGISSAAARNWSPWPLPGHHFALDSPGPEPNPPFCPVLHPLVARYSLFLTPFNKDTGLIPPDPRVYSLFVGGARRNPALSLELQGEGTQGTSGKPT